MKFMSFFSGIEAASVAWKPLGWECVSVSEIDEFASAVLAHRYPNVPNLGDITKISEDKLNEIKRKHNGIDLIIGGSPCQSFSIAGLRKGLKDPRGNLMLEYARIVHTIRPRFFIWENVVGALSTNGGRDFGTLLTTMAKFGYRLQWRVLDAQFFGVAQRRRRVFLVGYLGNKPNWDRILFEPNCGKGNHTESQNEWGDDSSEIEDSLDGDYSERELSLSDMLFGGSNEVEEEPQESQEPQPKKENPFVFPSNWHPNEGEHTNVSPTLTTKGSVRVVENDQDGVWFLPTTQPNGVTLFRKTNISSTLVAAMGGGGGHIPNVVENKTWVMASLHNNDVAGFKASNVSPTLLATMSHDVVPRVFDEEKPKSVWIMRNSLVGGIQGFGLSSVSPTLLAGMGLGGNVVPMLLDETSQEDIPKVFITRGDNWGAISCGRYDHVAPTLVCFVGSRPVIIDEKPKPFVMASTNSNDISNAKHSNVAPTLCTFVGQKPMILEEPFLFHNNYKNHPPKPQSNCPTLMASMGGGGGHIPFVVENVSFYQSNNFSGSQYALFHSNYSSYGQLREPVEKAHTLMAAMGKEPRMVPMVMEENIIASIVQPKEDIEQVPISLYNGAVNTDVFHTLTAATAINASGPRLWERSTYRNRIRKLTEIECERLQGFPDNWTKIPYKGKPESNCPKSPRYKCLGNSMAVPVIEWIGTRIEKFDNNQLT